MMSRRTEKHLNWPLFIAAIIIVFAILVLTIAWIFAPRSAGQATITSASLTAYWDGNGMAGVLKLIVENIGKLPITKADCVFLPEVTLSNDSLWVLPGKKIQFLGTYRLASYPGISIYPVTVHVTYFDGTTQTIGTSVTAQPG